MVKLVLLLGAVASAVVLTVVACGSSEVARPHSAVIGKGYPHLLYTHCGVREAMFSGRLWLAQPRLDDGRGNSPAGWDDPLTEGVMVLLRSDLAVFRSESGQVAEFVPWPRGRAREPCY